MRKKLIGAGLPALLVVALSFTSLAWEADFEVSSYNPVVGEAVTFAVCEPCLDGGSFSYAWDFDGDGTIDLETDQGTVDHSFSEPGFYRVVLTLTDAGGRSKTHADGIVVGVVPAFAKRDLLLDSDGSLFVLITITISEDVSAPGFREAIPRGWTVEILDPSGAITNVNSQTRELEVLWGSAFEAGAQLTFSYRLHPAFAGNPPEFSGRLSGYANKQRFVAVICGELSP